MTTYAITPPVKTILRVAALTLCCTALLSCRNSTQKEGGVFQLEYHGIYDIAFSADGRLLAIGVKKCVRDEKERAEVILKDMIKEKEISRFRCSAGAKFLAISPNGKLLATQSGAGKVSIYDLLTNKQIATIGYSCQVWKMEFSPDNKLLAVSTIATDRYRAGKVLLWDVSARKEVRNLEDNTKPTTLVGFAGNNQIVSTDGRSIRLWDLTSKKLKKEFESSVGFPRMAVSPDGTIVAVADQSEGSAQIWNIKTGQHLFALRRKNAKTVWEKNTWSLDFSDDGEQLAAGFSDGAVVVWNVKKKTVQVAFQHRSATDNVLFWPQRNFLLSSSQYSLKLNMIDLANKKERIIVVKSNFK